MRQINKIIGLALIGGIICINAALPSGSEEEINNLKAVFIYNFTKYITWPNLEKVDTFRIVVVGDSKIIASLQKMAAKKLVRDKPIKIIHYDNAEELENCHIVFISESESDRLDAIMTRLKRRAILTVGDTPGFGKYGLMINFFIQDGMVKFEMNPAKPESAGLKISSQLLNLARIIE